jgi:hypothetical protein
MLVSSGLSGLGLTEELRSERQPGAVGQVGSGEAFSTGSSILLHLHHLPCGLAAP